MTVMKVLIVDDEVEICMLLKRLLNRLEIDSDTANSLKEASKLVDERNFDVVFLDVNLPDGNGLSMIPKIHARRQGTKVIVSSAFTSDRELSDVEKSDIYKILPKPFSKENVLQIFGDIKSN